MGVARGAVVIGVDHDKGGREMRPLATSRGRRNERATHLIDHDWSCAVLGRTRMTNGRKKMAEKLKAPERMKKPS